MACLLPRADWDRERGPAPPPRVGYREGVEMALGICVVNEGGGGSKSRGTGRVDDDDEEPFTAAPVAEDDVESTPFRPREVPPESPARGLSNGGDPPGRRPGAGDISPSLP